MEDRSEKLDAVTNASAALAKAVTDLDFMEEDEVEFWHFVCASMNNWARQGGVDQLAMLPTSREVLRFLCSPLEKLANDIRVAADTLRLYQDLGDENLALKRKIRRLEKRKA